MGKGLLILVLGTSIAGGVMMMSKETSRMANTAEEARYEEAVLAREAAQSAFNIVAGRVKRNFDSYRSVQTARPYGAATYDISAQENADGDIEIIAIGKYGDFEHQIEGTVSRSGDRLVDAIIIDSPIDKLSLKSNYLVSGLDKDVDGSAGPGPNVHAILTTSSSALDELQDDIDDDQVVGREGEGDVVMDEPVTAPAVLEAAILAYSGGSLATYSGKQKWDDKDSMGSADAPVLVRVSGNVELKKTFVGHGILYVYGDLKMSNDAVWNGLVFVADSGAKLDLKNDAAIVGSLILMSSSGMDVSHDEDPSPDGDAGLVGGHFDVDSFDEEGSSKEMSHEHRYDDKHDVQGVNLLLSGCGSGGLCWDNVFAEGDITNARVTFMNPGSADGTYTITEGGTTHTGDISDGISLDFDPTDLTTFELDFNTMCALAPSKPSEVQGDPANRDGALSIKVVDKDAGSELVYELAVYHHWKEGECGDEPGKADEAKSKKSKKSKKGDDGDDSGDDEDSAGGDPVEVKLDGDVRIQYSSQAIKRLGSLINALDLESAGFTVNRRVDSGRVKVGHEQYKGSIR